ncbi:MAG: ArsR/SmtB family transcription factor [Candidatus Heimdallarchaeota archaeon]
MSKDEKVELESTISKLIDETDLKHACCSVDDWEKKINDIRGFVEADTFSAVLSVVSNPIRLKILLIILERDWACNCEFEYILSIHQTLISHHLKKLRDAKLISYKRTGKWKFYRITDEARSFLEELRETLFRVPELKE